MTGSPATEADGPGAGRQGGPGGEWPAAQRRAGEQPASPAGQAAQQQAGPAKSRPLLSEPAMANKRRGPRVSNKIPSSTSALFT